MSIEKLNKRRRIPNGVERPIIEGVQKMLRYDATADKLEQIADFVPETDEDHEAIGRVLAALATHETVVERWRKRLGRKWTLIDG